MPQIIFIPETKSCEAENGITLQDAAERAGVTLSFPCAGKGVCGKCLVKVAKGSVEFNDNGKLRESLKEQGFVLACRSKVNGDAIIMNQSLGDEQGQFSDALSHMSVDDGLFPKPEDIKPITAPVKITVDEPLQGDGLGDRDRFINAAAGVFGDAPIDIPINVMRKLPDVLREREGEISVWHTRKNGAVSVVDIEAGGPSKNYGISIDIGTTTVALRLVDIDGGGVALDTVTHYNAQIDRGADVISRISYAKNPERIAEMRALVLSTINKGISELRERNGGLPAECVRNLAVAGNTTMTQLFMGINPNYIRLEPYTPAVMSVPLYTAGDLGVEINKGAYVWIAPNVGSYVGGDITAGLLCTDFALCSDEISLFIDIGTNGEIVLGNCDFLMSCACSAGPAFEGGGIEKGMRASVGAIDSVEVDYVTGYCRYFVIGGGEPHGICGSGLISLLSQLFEAGIIDQRGKMDRSGRFDSIQTLRKNSRYFITEAQDDSGVYITENDIDNFIRAKAAIFSACLTMLKNVDLTFDDVSKFYIAGGFGRYIDIDRAQSVGLLPPLDREKFLYIGNSSLTGSYMSLLSERHRDKKMELANRITYVDLSVEPSYMDEYVAAMFIPHTDLSMFSRRAVSC